MRIAAVVAAVLFAAAAYAQVPILTTIPSPPVAGVPFTIRVSLAACYSLTGVTVNGSNIDVIAHFEPLCIATPPIVTSDIAAGPLPAGNYTIRLLPDDSTTPVATLPVAITANIPALDPRVLAMLAATMIAVAAFRLRAR